MEKEILEVLKSIQLDIKGVKDDVKYLKDSQERIEKKLDGVVEETMDLVEFRSEILNKIDWIREDLATLELVTATNYKDIAKLKAVK